MFEYPNITQFDYKSANGYSGNVRHSVDEYYNVHIELVIYNPAGKCKALFILNDIPQKEELQHLVDDFPKYVGLLKEGEKHE